MYGRLYRLILNLNLIYLPTGNTAADNYGGHRNGSDYYSSSVVALDASSGEVVWHFSIMIFGIMMFLLNQLFMNLKGMEKL